MVRKTVKRHQLRNLYKKIKGEMEPHSTFGGLQIWFKSLFEELGWMVLAKHMGYKDKVEVYKNNIRRFQRALRNAEEELEEPDHLRDLQILKERIQILEKHVHHDFD